MAILAKNFLLGISTVLPFQICGLKREVVFIVVNLVTAGAKVGLQMKRRLVTIMETHPAVV